MELSVGMFIGNMDILRDGATVFQRMDFVRRIEHIS